MNDSFTNNIDNYQQALVSAGDLIYQEVYRFSLYKVASKEVQQIKNMYLLLSDELEQFQSIYHTEHIENIGLLALDLIVLGADTNSFTKAMNESIVDKQFAEMEFDWLINGDGTEKQKKYRKNIHEKTLQVLLSVYYQYSGFQTVINHRYPPRLIACEQDYEVILDYFHNEHYLLKKVPLEEHEKDDKFFAGTTHKFVSCQQPFQTFRAYENRIILDINHVFQEYEIPKNTLAKRITSGERFKINCDKNEVASFIELEAYNHAEQCQVCSTVEFKVDISSPMSARELEQTVARFRNEIHFVQHNNRISSMLLASTFKELETAYLQPRLKNVPISELMEIFSSGLTGKLTFKKVKLLLCGMMLYKARWLESKKVRKSILELTNDLSESLTEEYGRGFSVQNINRGYQQINQLLKDLLEESELIQITSF